MRIYRAKDYDEMSRKAANIIAAQMTLKPDSVLGLATGSTPIGTYRELIARYSQGDRGLPRENDQSYYYFMYENLFRHVNIDMANTNIPNGMEPDSDAECARYEKVIESLGGVDLQLLGLGHNGHIGFNEPADHFARMTNCVNLQASTIEANKRFFESADQVPKQAYTMGIGTIMRAKSVLLIVSGADKAETLAKVIAGPVTPQVPASILQFHPNAIVVADEAALSGL